MLITCNFSEQACFQLSCKQLVSDTAKPFIQYNSFHKVTCIWLLFSTHSHAWGFYLYVNCILFILRKQRICAGT